jgi:L-asparaginase
VSYGKGIGYGYIIFFVTVRPRVHVIALGGTIAMQSEEEDGVPELSADRLLAGVPRLGDVAEVSVATAAMVPGASLTFPDLVAVAEEARLAVRDGATGVVITQGTDTIEETAYLWH